MRSNSNSPPNETLVAPPPAVQTMRQVAPPPLPPNRQVALPLTVKQLADSLGVSPRFVYQMRACGFPMSGDTHNRQCATLAEARAWIKANNFRLLKSIGVIGTHNSP